MQTSETTQFKTLYQETVRPSALAQLPLTLLFPLIFLMLLPIAPIELAVISGALAAVVGLVLVQLRAPRIRVELSAGQIILQVANARIEAKHLGQISVIEPHEVRAERGPKLNALAHVNFVSSAPKMLKIEIVDQADVTPYWLFSTRQPELIRQLLTVRLS